MASKLNMCKETLKKNLLLLLILFGVLVGVGLGFLVRLAEPSDNVLMWLGELFYLYRVAYEKSFI